ncbi:hypothetical protein K1T71_001514 [Dendrolimus kikuchii]|uniref:Uncharacterized protein n=1 Tax=Dendrolimus kikuchii TaxID=765133 RepID=A0ACC1DIQ3_9NEOP|nr:hypothetical protein K1T71_001514 [Dendrolimus kikuchii]
MRAIIVLFACASIYYNKVSANLAPFITPCHAHDTACLKSSAQKAVPILAAGVPSLGIEKMDPMRLDRVQASQAGLNMDFRNTVVKGLRNCEVLSLKRKTTKTDLEIKCSVILQGDYKLDGKLLILPIEGNGKYKIKIRNRILSLDYRLLWVRYPEGWLLKLWRTLYRDKTGTYEVNHNIYVYINNGEYVVFFFRFLV